MKSSNPFPYRLAAIDIDGTLVSFDRKISPENAAAIAELRRRGVHVILASGRSHENMLTFHTQLGLNGHIISAQGALTRHAETGHVLHEHPLNASDAIAVINRGRALGLTNIAYGRGRIFADRAGKWSAAHAEEILHTEKVHQADLIPEAERGLLKVIWAGEPDLIAGAMAEAIEHFAGRSDTALTAPYYLEFTAHGINKSAGMIVVARAMNIAQHEVLAFGDGNNDVAMLAWAGMGVAMDTGAQAAKRAANRISPSGDPQTALARAIYELLNDDRPAFTRETSRRG
jgi:hypothetical protein